MFISQLSVTRNCGMYVWPLWRTGAMVTMRSALRARPEVGGL